MNFKIIISMKMWGKLIVCVWFCTFCAALQPGSQEGQLPPIGSLFFEEECLVYISQNQQEFGEINIENGQIQKRWSLDLDKGEKMLAGDQHEIIVGSEESITMFTYFVKTQDLVDNRLIPNNTESLYGYQRTEFGVYYLTDDELKFEAPGRPDELDDIDLGQDYGQFEDLLSIFTFNYRLIIFSDNGEEYCFGELDMAEFTRKICLPSTYHPEEIPEVQATGQYVYMTTESYTLVLDRDFSVVEQLEHEALQYHQGTMTLLGYKTYLPGQRSVEDFKVVSHNDQDSALITMRLSEEEGEEDTIIIQKSGQEVAQIDNIPSEPTGAWVDKSEAPVDYAWGFYSLAVQFESKEMRYYEIDSTEDSNSTTVELVWTHE